MKRTKIVATLGPSSIKDQVLEKMLYQGVNVFRVNFSHGNAEENRKTILKIQATLKKTKLHAAILADLQGPKLRIGTVEEGAFLEPGDLMTFTNKPCSGTKEKVFMTYDSFPKDVKVGEMIMLDDGKLLMRVVSSDSKNEVIAETIQGGPLKSNKGVNLPNTRVSLPCLTDKDIYDLNIALDAGVDWVGLSFVRGKQDIKDLRKIINEKKSNAGIIAKIEKPEAVSDIDAILDETDAVMVARGDLGVEVPMESVPLIQKMIISKAISRAKPVIVATQMMESMINSLTPSRAEVNDVSCAVIDGADAVMLSAETSIGQYPVEVVETMSKIVKASELSSVNRIKGRKPQPEDKSFVSNALCYQAAKTANLVEARSICALTFSGYSAKLISSFRPKSNVYVFTSNRSILNKLCLFWGVTGFYYDSMESTDQTFVEISKMLKSLSLIEDGDTIIQLASMPIKKRGMTNTMRIKQIGA
jgi:pyruvate kinase